MSRPQISLAMIVKNEERFLAQALASVAPWVDEMVVVDTGSTDRTVEIAADSGARVETFAWCDNFSAARNASIEHCTGDWIFVLDGDETLSGRDPDDLRRVLGDPKAYPFGLYEIDMHNVMVGGDTIDTIPSIRAFPRDPGLRYVGRVHNQLKAVDASRPQVRTHYLKSPRITHFGYDPEVYAAREKSGRALHLLELASREDPSSWLLRYYLAREKKLTGRVDEALTDFAHLVPQMVAANADRQPLEEALGYWVDCLNICGGPLSEVQRVLALAAKSVKDAPTVLFAAAFAHELRGVPDAALELYQRALAASERRCRTQEAYSTLLDVHWVLKERVARTLAEVGRFSEAHQFFSEAVREKPERTGDWPRVLNLAVGVAMEVGDHAGILALLARICGREDTDLAMVFAYADQLGHREGVEAARQMLGRLAADSPRLASDRRAVKVLASAACR